MSGSVEKSSYGNYDGNIQSESTNGNYDGNIQSESTKTNGVINNALKNDYSIDNKSGMSFNKNNRVNWIDFIRGLAIVNMVLYHLIYDLVYIYGYEISWFSKNPGYYWQQYICWSFIMVSGISMSFSKDNLKRGTRIMLLALLITAVTTAAGPELSIKFGILHFIGLGLIISHFLYNLMHKVKSSIGMTVSFMVFITTKYMVYNSNQFFEYFISEQTASDLIYRLRSVRFMFLFGFPNNNFKSADYFPLIPWLFLLWTGYFIGKWIKSNLYMVKKIDIGENIVSKIGRHSLKIYILHQIIIMAALQIILK